MALDGEPPVQAQRLGRYGRHHRRIAVADRPRSTSPAEPLADGAARARIVLGERAASSARHAAAAPPRTPHRRSRDRSGPRRSRPDASVRARSVSQSSVISAWRVGDRGRVFAREQIGIVEPPERLPRSAEASIARVRRLASVGCAVNTSSTRRSPTASPSRSDVTPLPRAGPPRPRSIRRSAPGAAIRSRSTQGADALRLLGEVHEIEIDGEGRGHDPGGVRRQGLRPRPASRSRPPPAPSARAPWPGRGCAPRSRTAHSDSCVRSTFPRVSPRRWIVPDSVKPEALLDRDSQSACPLNAPSERSQGCWWAELWTRPGDVARVIAIRCYNSPACNGWLIEDRVRRSLRTPGRPAPALPTLGVHPRVLHPDRDRPARAAADALPHRARASPSPSTARRRASSASSPSTSCRASSPPRSGRRSRTASSSASPPSTCSSSTSTRRRTACGTG